MNLPLIDESTLLTEVIEVSPDETWEEGDRSLVWGDVRREALYAAGWPLIHVVEGRLVVEPLTTPTEEDLRAYASQLQLTRPFYNGGAPDEWANAPDTSQEFEEYRHDG